MSPLSYLEQKQTELSKSKIHTIISVLDPRMEEKSE